MRGRVACVTGANSGIGYSAAKSLAQRNCTVHMLCRNQERGEQARTRVTEETGNDDVHLHVVDVSDFQQVRVASRAARREDGVGKTIKQKVSVCVCVCFLPIHSGHQVRWTYQPGSHRRKVTQDF